MNILISGVAGFLGSHLAERMLLLGHRVYGFDTLQGGDRANVPDKAEFWKVDCCDFPAMKSFFPALDKKDRIDLIYHCAATPHEGLSVFSPNVVTHNVYQSTVSLATAAIAGGVKRFVFLSSMARYGRQPFVPFTEDCPPNPVDPYGVAKLAAEKTLEILSREHGMEFCVAVPHNIIGEKQRYCMARGSLLKTAKGFRTIENDLTVVDDPRHRLVRIAGGDHKISDFISLGRKAAISLTLETGQKVVVGSDHLFRSLEKSRVVWRKAADLRQGDVLTSESPVYLDVDREDIDFKKGQMIGLLISDGTYNGSDYEASIACCVEEDKPDLRSLLDEMKDCFFIPKWAESEKGSFRISSREFILWLRQMDMKAVAHDKTIPLPILSLSHDFVAGVLSGIFSGDGWVAKDQNIVGLASVSEELIRTVQKVLLAYGIKSTIYLRDQPDDREIEGRKINSGPIWWLSILSENVGAFSKIGFLYKRKQRTLLEKGNIKPSSEIPYLGREIYSIREFLPVSVRSQKPNVLNTKTVNGSVTRFSLDQLCGLLDDWLISEEAAICPEYADFIASMRDLWRLIVAGGHQIRVKSIEHVEAELFDISVDSNEHAYVGDGLICHNCDPYRNVAAIFINLMLQGKQPTIYGDGKQRRVFSYVGDCIDPLVKMGFFPGMNGAVINIGPDDNPVTILELAQEIARQLAFRLEPNFLPARPCEVKEAWPSAERARKWLEYKPKTTLPEALSLMIADIRARGPKPFEYNLPLEILNDRTPKSWSERLF